MERVSLACVALCLSTHKQFPGWTACYVYHLPSLLHGLTCFVLRSSRLFTHEPRLLITFITSLHSHIRRFMLIIFLHRAPFHPWTVPTSIVPLYPLSCSQQRSHVTLSAEDQHPSRNPEGLWPARRCHITSQVGNHACFMAFSRLYEGFQQFPEETSSLFRHVSLRFLLYRLTKLQVTTYL